MIDVPAPELKHPAAPADHVPSAVRRLKPNQRVEIHIECGEHVVACRVAAVQGSVAALTRITERPPDALDKFAAGALGYLLFEHADGPDFRLELSLDQDPEPIRCLATVVRATPTHVALKLTEIADADRIRFAGLIQRRTLSVA